MQKTKTKKKLATKLNGQKLTRHSNSNGTLFNRVETQRLSLFIFICSFGRSDNVQLKQGC